MTMRRDFLLLIAILPYNKEVYAANSKSFLTPVPPKAPRLYTS